MVSVVRLQQFHAIAVDDEGLVIGDCHNLVVNLLPLGKNKFAPSFRIMRKDASPAREQVETFIAQALEVPLLTEARVIPALPERHSHRTSSAHGAGTRTHIDQTKVEHERGHEAVETALVHVMPEVERVSHVHIDAICGEQVVCQRLGRSVPQLDVFHVTYTEWRKLCGDSFVSNSSINAITYASVGHVERPSVSPRPPHSDHRSELLPESLPREAGARQQQAPRNGCRCR